MDRKELRRYSIADRDSKVTTEDFARKCRPGIGFTGFVDSLPSILQAKDFLLLAEDVVRAVRNEKPVLVFYGGHVVKVGLAPLFCQGLEEGWITYAATNGAGTIHDFELCCYGHTSENVDDSIEDGSFGMTEETGRDWNLAVNEGHRQSLGLGEALGRWIREKADPLFGPSIAATAVSVGRPITVHVAIGTDVTHCHPEAFGEALGGTSYRDFETLCERVAELHDGGVVLNIGSAVILPEVFLKALSTARNLAGPVTGFTTANLDMIRHYRPSRNVLSRPTRKSGRSVQLVGPHEILVPLLFQTVCEKLG